MKLIVGILACDEGGYDKMVEAARNTCYSLKMVPDDTEVFYIYGHRTGITIPTDNYKIDEDCFYHDSPEHPSKMNVIKKTLSFFEYCYNNKDFDYILRPNCGSYVSLPLLKKHIFQNNFPKEGMYCGITGNHAGIRFVSGACTLISRDIIGLIVKNKDTIMSYGRTLMDDVAIGKFLIHDSKIITPHGALRRGITLSGILSDNFEINNDCYHYYFLRTRDPRCFHELHKKLKERGLI